ncbi:MAG: 30S ribosomal protein S5 [Clostridiales bacterium]|nr:30S ribosomal protein S5 [Clostridiales bacterium]
MAEQQKRFRKPRTEVHDEFSSKNVHLRRVTKVVKGGRNMRFSSLVVVGDKKGRVGMGISRAIEVPAAIEKATKAGKKALINVPVINGTIPHEVIGKFAKTSVKMLPSKPGSGLIAGGAARIVLEMAGYTDITAKIYGSTDKINVVRATLNGLKALRTKEQVAMLRGKSVEEI